jgi:hypothetical protein
MTWVIPERAPRLTQTQVNWPSRSQVEAGKPGSEAVALNTPSRRGTGRPTGGCLRARSVAAAGRRSYPEAVAACTNYASHDSLWWSEPASGATSGPDRAPSAAAPRGPRSLPRPTAVPICAGRRCDAQLTPPVREPGSARTGDPGATASVDSPMTKRARPAAAIERALTASYGRSRRPRSARRPGRRSRCPWPTHGSAWVTLRRHTTHCARRLPETPAPNERTEPLTLPRRNRAKQVSRCALHRPRSAVRDYRTGLLPWVRAIEAHSWEGVQDVGGWQPAGGEGGDGLGRHPAIRCT